MKPLSPTTFIYRNGLHSASFLGARIGAFTSKRAAQGLVAALFFLLLTPTGAAAAVSCGDTLVGYNVLTSDLSCTTGFHALYMAAGSTLDFNGRGLGGDPSMIGIQVLGDNVSLVGPGVIKDFQIAVNSFDVDNLYVGALTFVDAGTGVILNSAENSKVERNEFFDLRGIGVAIRVSDIGTGRDARLNSVQVNSFERVRSAIELCGEATYKNFIVENTILDSPDFGIALRERTHRNSLQNNEVHRTGNTAVAIISSSMNIIRGGRYTDNRVGFWITSQPTTNCRVYTSDLSSNDNSLSGLSLFDNQVAAILGDSSLDPVERNQIEDSKLYNNITGVDLRPWSAGNLIRHNAFCGTPTPILDTGTGNVTTPNGCL